MKRREFIALLGAASVWPVAGLSQQAMPVIGFLGLETPELFAARLRELRRGLSEAGYVEGQNVRIEYRWAEGQYDRMPAMVADLVRAKVAVIVTPNFVAALASTTATTAIPIVFNTSADPVALGLVSSLSAPGGNATGVASLGMEIAAKRLELLHELVPAATSFGLLVNPKNTALADSSSLQAAAGKLGLKLHVVHASTEHDIDAAFAAMAELKIGGLVISTDAIFSNRLDQLAALTARYSLPAISQYRGFAVAGGLISYGTACWRSIGSLAFTPAGFSGVTSLPTCRSSRRQKSR
jgi:putative ABC transport system substrate-binding protein